MLPCKSEPKPFESHKVWNSLPIDLKNTVLTIDDFKKKLRKNMNDENSIILSHLSYYFTVFLSCK